MVSRFGNMWDGWGACMTTPSLAQILTLTYVKLDIHIQIFLGWHAVLKTTENITSQNKILVKILIFSLHITFHAFNDRL